MPQASAVRVLIAIKDPVAAIGLHTILSRPGEMECLPVPKDLGDIRGLVAEGVPDVLLLDVDLRRRDAALLSDLVKAHPRLRILVYVDHSPEDCALRHMLQLGGRARLSNEALARLDDCCLTSLKHRAHGCLGSGVEADSIVHSVRAVHAGEVVAAPWLASLARMIHTPSGRSRSTSAISARELEVMALLAEGLSNRQIAERLGIQEQTVKNHVTRTMEKLGVSNRLEVGLLAARHHLKLAAEESPAP